ncbi:MAG TPA: metallophosphoesterase [Desulfomonilia bacterium]
MKVFAISDLHLGFGSNKPMDIFGRHWDAHPERIRKEWTGMISDEDLVLVAGDISWAMKPIDAKADLAFLGELPGKKIIIKGNHDFWWQGLKKVREIAPATVMPLHNSSYETQGIGIAGSRLWIDPSLNLEKTTDDDEKLFERELGRLKNSIETITGNPEKIIIMTHFPPISPDGKAGKAVEMLKEFNIHTWVFGHMHIDGNDYSGFNTTIANTRFVFTSADCIDFRPVRIL